MLEILFYMMIQICTPDGCQAIVTDQLYSSLKGCQENIPNIREDIEIDQDTQIIIVCLEEQMYSEIIEL